MLGGLRYAAMSPHLRIVLLRGLTLGLAASSISALMPMIARILLGGGPLTFGLLSGSFGVGAVAGALINAPMRHRTGPEAVFRLGVLAFAGSAAIAAMSSWSLLTMVAMTFGGVGWVTTLSTLTVSIQMSTPRWVVARGIAIYQMTTFGGMGIGSWLWGIAAEHEGLRMALAISAGALVAISFLGFRFPLDEPDEASAEPWPVRDRPEPAVDIEHRSGPIVTTIEYRIRPEDRAAFSRAMLKLRRIRLRDGARDWSLMQDLSDPARWVERFHSPTWMDHLRRRSRLTQADRESSEIARSFHQGEGPPLASVLLSRPRNALAAIADERRAGDDTLYTDPGINP
jgi:MFS family permease